jgi:hypothetical protein
MAEIARVMRHDGIGLHLFPSRNVLIEPHMFVPLATKVQSWWWFYLWALLGIRNEYQAGMSAREVADRNYRYSQTGVRYQRDCDMRAAGGQHFGAIYFVDTQFHAGSTWRENLRAARSAIFSRHPLRALGTLPRFRALFVTKPVHRSRDAADQQTGWGR